MRVQVHGIYRTARRVNHADPAFRNAATHRAGAGTGAFKANVVFGVGVAHIHLAAAGMDSHVEQRRAYATHPRLQSRRSRVGIDGEQVVVRQRELDRGRPVHLRLVAPGRAVELDDQSSIRGAHAVAARQRRRFAIEHSIAMQGCRAIAREQRRGVDRCTVGADGQGARRIRKQRENGQRIAVKTVVEIRCIKHPDIGASLTRRGEAGRCQVGAILAAKGCSHKSTVAIGPGEHNVPWLVAHL